MQRGGGVTACECDRVSGCATESNSITIASAAPVCDDCSGFTQAHLSHLVKFLMIQLCDPALHQPDWYLAALPQQHFGYRTTPPMTARQANVAFKGARRPGAARRPTVSQFGIVLCIWLAAVLFFGDAAAFTHQPAVSLGTSDLVDALADGDAYLLWNAGHRVHDPGGQVELPPVHSTLNSEIACNLAALDSRVNPALDINCSAYASALDGFLPHGDIELVPGQGFEKTEHGWTIGHHPDFSAEQIDQLKSMLASLKSSCFAYSLSDLTGYTGEHGLYRIPLTCSDNKPIFTKPRQHSVAEYAVLDEKMQLLLDAGIIMPSRQTKYVSEVVIAAKKNELGEWVDKRVCQDYRPLNTEMHKDNYRLPLADDIFDTVGECGIFSVVDMRSGFYSIGIHPDDQAKTAFWWKGEVFQFTRMPFGLHSAPQHYQRIVDHELRSAGCFGFARAYIDDVIIFSKTAAEHIEHLRRVLSALGGVGLKIHPEKSRFACSVVEYLGFNVSKFGLTPHQAKVAAIAALKPPTNVSELRSVLGLMCYYRRFVPNFSSAAEPLNRLLKKNVPFDWGDEQQAALDHLKTMLTTEGLALKRVDSSKPLLLYTDWSQRGVGAVLAQTNDEGVEHICACISRSLNKHEANYCSFKGELLAVVWACLTLRHHLHGVPVTVITDHEPLKWLVSKKDLHGQYGRWAMILADYDLTIVHRAGASHVNADALSRMPRDSSTDTSGARMDGPCVAVDSNACLFLECQPADMWVLDGSPVVSPLVLLADQLSMSPLTVSSGFCMLHATANCSSPASSSVDWQLLAQLACNSARECDVMRYAGSVDGAQAELSSFLVDRSDLLTGNLGSLADEGVKQVSSNCPVAEQRCRELKSRVTGWHVAAAQQLQSKFVDPAMVHDWRPACIMRRGKDVQPVKDQHGVQPTAAICTRVIGQQFFSHACSYGIVVCELFGGICSGLEMALRSGMMVQKYFYCDKDPVARRIAAYRLHQLNGQYPALLSRDSYRYAFTALPQDVAAITSDHLVRAGAQNGDQWLVVAGFECQDLSPAGSGKGLSGGHSVTFFAMKRVLGALQQLQPQLPPGYFIENTYLRHNFGALQQTSAAEYQFICQCIGHPLACDAAQFGSYAHRLRHYWTNLAHLQQLEVVLQHVHRPVGLKVTDILRPGRVVLAAVKSDAAPFYRCNVKGEPLSALPTFTAYRMSRAFKAGQPGAVFDGNQRCWTEPNAEERELAMGFDQGCTYVPAVLGQIAVDDAARHAALGKAMDMNAVSSLFAMCQSLSTPAQAEPAAVSTSLALPSASAQAAATVVQFGSDACVCQPLTSAAALSNVSEVEPFYSSTIYCMAAVHDQASCNHVVKRDIWMDAALLHFVREGVVPAGLSARELRQLHRRAALYQWLTVNDGDKVHESMHRKMPDGTTRVVPPPGQRQDLVKQMHTKAGHFGEKRTIQLLLSQFYWYGLYKDVYEQVKSCDLCRRVNLAFNARSSELQPLPIMALGYRWSVDLCGEFLPTKSGNKWVMVCIEHLSKWVEVIALPEKTAMHTARAFLSHVLSRFSAMAVVCSDQGTEFRGQFDALLESALIDHRVTALHRPQGNGLAERMVQTFKKALRKYCQQESNIDTWDEGMHWIALGYRCSPQASTKISPYELMFARRPVVPPAIVQRLSQPINFDDPDLAAECLLQRAAVVQQLCPEAMANLRIAQHRDKKRYAQINSGSYKPALLKFFPGQFVYVQDHDVQNTLQIRARPEILRVVAVKPQGQVTLQGKCGTTIQQNIVNLAPCHLPNIDPTVDTTLARPPEDLPCEVCGSPYDEARMLLCSNCATGWHLQCLTPPLKRVPAGAWLCPYCVAAGVDIGPVEVREAVNEQYRQDLAQQARLDVAPLFGKQRRRMLAEAELLHGRFIIYPFPGPNRTKVPTWGLVQYRGHQHYPRCMRVYYPSGQHFDVTLRSVRPYLQRPHARPPADVHIAIPASDTTVSSAMVAAQQQPAAPAIDLTAVHLRMPALLSRHSALTGTDLAVLSTVIDFSAVRQVFDPAATSIAAYKEFAPCVVANTLSATQCVETSSHLAALQPAFWQHVRSTHPLVEAVVCKPWYPDACIDLAMSSFSNGVDSAFIMVPCRYLASTTPFRAAFLRHLQQAGRLHIIKGPPCGHGNLECVWLCIYRTPGLRASRLQPDYRAEEGCVSYVYG